MLHEAVDALLAPGLPGTYVDATFGRGAYSAEILRHLPPGGRLVVCIDPVADPLAAAAARDLMRADPRITDMLHCSLGEVGTALAGQEIAGAVADLGSAWLQDDPLKGMSCVNNAPLDMRANTTRGISAADWLKTAAAAELAWVLHAYGEDDDPVMALRLAEAVLERQRRHGPYQTTFQLVDVVRRLKGQNEERGLHPAKLTLQALRIFVNGEMEQLQDFLEDTVPLLAPGARLAIVTTRRAEAAAVKSFTRRHEDCHPSFSKISTPSRLLELYPLLQTPKSFAVLQSSQPLWPSATIETAGRRPPRAMATHVLQRAPRRSRAVAAGDGGGCEGGGSVAVGEARARSYHELFAQPRALPFSGGC